MILCRFKSPPWGFLFINYFSSFFFSSIFCLWIEHQSELVYTHNAEQIKNKDDRGKRWIHCSSHPCSFEEIQCSRTHLYNISTQQKKNGYVHVNSLGWTGSGRVVVMKGFACSVFYPPRWLNLPEVWRRHGNQDAESDCCSVCLAGKKWDSLLKLHVCLCLCVAVGA